MRRLALFVSLAATPAIVAGAQTVPLSRADAVQDAIARSPRSGVLVADTAVAFAQLLTARALPNPSLSASYTKSTPMYHVTADFPVDYLWLHGTRVQAAQLSRDAARYRYTFGRAMVALDADTTYTRALAAAARSRLSGRTAQDTDSLRRMAVARRNAGDASELDVQLATVSAAQQANIAAADSLTAVSVLLDLQAILGLPTNRVEIVLTDSLTEPPTDGAVAQAGATLPVAAADAALQAALLGSRLQRRSIWSGAGFMFGFETGDPSSGGTGNAILPTFGVTVPLPFLDRNRGAIALADAERLRAEFELALARVETQSRLAHANRERLNAVGRIARDRVTVAAANQVATMSLTAYREGAMALPNVLEAQRTAREVLAQYIDDLAAAWIAAAELRVFSLSPSPSRPQ